MTRWPIVLGVAATLALTACVTTAPQETCTDRSGAVYAKPEGGCPALVATPVYRKPVAVAARVPVRTKPVPVVEPARGEGGSDGGSDGGSNDGGGWGN